MKRTVYYDQFLFILDCVDTSYSNFQKSVNILILHKPKKFLKKVHVQKSLGDGPSSKSLYINHCDLQNVECRYICRIVEIYYPRYFWMRSWSERFFSIMTPCSLYCSWYSSPPVIYIVVLLVVQFTACNIYCCTTSGAVHRL